jgi:hypothetical protein
MMFTAKNIANFWRKVSIAGEDECWLWLGGKSDAGYGRFCIRPKWFGSHQIALLITGVERPPGYNALHSCDNRLCCNPKHLRWGTLLENAKEMKARNRNVVKRGENNNNAKLSEDDVRAIRCDTRAQTIIAKAYGVSQVSVSKIKRRLTWIYVDDIPSFQAISHPTE